jgi:hypothetical protein
MGEQQSERATGGPDLARYETLVQRLLELQRLQPSLDPLTASYEAIATVWGFLSADVRLLEAEATRPLGQLMLALLDRSRGREPELFFDQPDRMGAMGRPSHTSAAILRAYANLAFLSLREAGMSDGDASGWLAAELRHADIKQANEAIEATAIVRWSAELGGKSLKGSDEVFALVIRGAQRLLSEGNPQTQPNDAPTTQQQAKATALGLIKLLKTAGF